MRCVYCDTTYAFHDGSLMELEAILAHRTELRIVDPHDAAVVDQRVWEAQGNMAPDGVYLVGQPGPALPLSMAAASVELAVMKKLSRMLL